MGTNKYLLNGKNGRYAILYKNKIYDFLRKGGNALSELITTQ